MYYINNTNEIHNSICIGNKNCIIRDIDGRRMFGLTYDASLIPNFQRQVLEEGLCKGLLTMKFLVIDKELWIFYDFDGLQQINKLISILHTSERCLALELCRMLHSLTSCILEGENYLLSSEGFSLHPDTIFIDPTSLDVKIAYVPTRICGKSIQENVIELLSAIEKLTNDDQWKAYSDNINEYIKISNPGLIKIAEYICDTSRQIQTRLWPEKDNIRHWEPEEERVEEGSFKRIINIAGSIGKIDRYK